MADSIAAELRTEFGKGAARRARRAKKIPAVLYGHGTNPVHLNLPSHEVFLVIKQSANAVLDIAFDGKSELALVKSVQKDVVSNDIEHIDLLLVRRGEKVTVDVAVVTEGESAPGTIHAVELQSLTVLAEATSIPERIVVSVEGLEEGTVVRVADLELPEGTTTEVDPEAAVVLVTVPRGEEEPEDEAAEGEAAAEESEEA
ncbi:50S ribosomal protein L25/general stress protein Ctc [Miniimonas arenae]|uniref:Large ribosomal subunit protein bL25 n=1 Tax=Miniimonas arenae TaxID=676201 RepID=A0A5C5B9Y5_9MICO|nr:50S ribosomal protein L25/general stress protein Ctc [Miniimonas arenae]TNU72822.1 50S ribosomal protein L25/general stress protein Ctc [Miniimonas arenae]